jgi:hypothetical protein
MSVRVVVEFEETMCRDGGNRLVPHEEWLKEVLHNGFEQMGLALWVQVSETTTPLLKILATGQRRY